jgi:cytochrome d ubiquinol oxidase subunit II
VHAIWYAILAAMLTAWAVLDGFDFGVGIVQRLVARTEQERATLLTAIGPVWNGNEVWLVAAGGVLVFAFPVAYAMALSGMYLALMLVLWLIVLRGVAIELRHQVNHPLWRTGWDGVFMVASVLLALVTGVALGNLVRGFPLGPSGWFHLDLFSHGEGSASGTIDGYSLLVGLTALAMLATHGATYLVWKTEGDVQRRSRLVAQRGWIVSLSLLVVATPLTAAVRPALFIALSVRPWLWPLPLLVVASPWISLRSLRPTPDRALRAFLASSAFLASLLLLTAGSLYPVILASTLGADHDLTVATASSAPHGLALGLVWWSTAMVLALLYFMNLFRATRGKADVEAGASHVE